MSLLQRHKRQALRAAPGLHPRERVAEGEPLRALLSILDGQADDIEGDIRQLYENAFIETCEPWAVPYIGDLVGTIAAVRREPRQGRRHRRRVVQVLNGPSLKPLIALRGRADVAKTIYYRRRKGTLPMLEELARDVTGWPAHAVEFFELLGWTQWVRNHLRLHALRTPDIRSVERMDRLDGAFDEIVAHGRCAPDLAGRGLAQHPQHRLLPVAARRLPHGAGRGAAARRSRRFPLPSSARSAIPRRCSAAARREGDEAGLATELHVPQPIRPARFFQAYRRFLRGSSITAFRRFRQRTAPSIMVFVDGAPVTADDVRCRNLSVWSQPTTDRIAVDVVRGRLTLGPALIPASQVEVYYHYGFPADLGGGPYRRRAWLMRPDFAPDTRCCSSTAAARREPSPRSPPRSTQWVLSGKPQRDHPHPRQPHLCRGDRHRRRGSGPTRARAGDRGGGRRAPASLARRAAAFDRRTAGLFRHAGRFADRGPRRDRQARCSRLRLLHTTLVPGVSIAEQDPAPPPPHVAPSITAAAALATGAPANTELAVELAFSICGPIRAAGACRGAVRARQHHRRGRHRCHRGRRARPTVPGPPVQARAHDDARPNPRAPDRPRHRDDIRRAGRRPSASQTGCVRFSYVPARIAHAAPLSLPARSRRAQGDRRAEEAQAGPLTDAAEATRSAPLVRLRVKPEYTAEAYGQPAYLQLSLAGRRRSPRARRTARRWGSTAISSSRSAKPICACG